MYYGVVGGVAVCPSKWAPKDCWAMLFGMFCKRLGYPNGACKRATNWCCCVGCCEHILYYRDYIALWNETTTWGAKVIGPV